MFSEDNGECWIFQDFQHYSDSVALTKWHSVEECAYAFSDQGLNHSRADMLLNIDAGLFKRDVYDSIFTLLYLAPRVKDSTTQQTVLALIIEHSAWTKNDTHFIVASAMKHDAELRSFITKHYLLNKPQTILLSARECLLVCLALQSDVACLLCTRIKAAPSLLANDPSYVKVPQDYISLIKCLVILLLAAKNTRDLNFDSIMCHFTSAVQFPWDDATQFTDEDRKASMDAVCDVYRVGICVSLPREFDEKTISFQLSGRGEMLTNALTVISSDIEAATNNEHLSVDDVLKHLAHCLSVAQSEVLDESFCKSICLSSPGIVSQAFLSAERHLVAWLLAATSRSALQFALQSVQAYRALIVPNVFRVSLDLDDSISGTDYSNIPTVFGLLALVSKPCPPDVLTTRFRVYYSRPLVDVAADSLEPLLLILEILVDRLYGSSMQSVCEVLQETSTAFRIIYGRPLSEFMCESLPGVFFFVSTQLWNETHSCKSDVWSLRELFMLSMAFEIIRENMKDKIDQAVSYLTSKRHPHNCDTQYSTHIVHVLFMSTTDRKQLLHLGQVLSQWAPFAVLRYFSKDDAIVKLQELQSFDSSDQFDTAPSYPVSATHIYRPSLSSTYSIASPLVSMSQLISGLASCSPHQCLILYMMCECLVYTSKSSCNENESLAINYLVQECLELLEFRSSAVYAKHGVSFSNQWARDVWSRLDPQLQSFLAPLLKSRYSYVSQQSGQDCSADLYTSKLVFDVLFKMLGSIPLPIALIWRLRAWIFLVRMLSDPKALSIASLSNEELANFFEAMLIMEPAVRVHNALFTCGSLEAMMKHIDIYTVCTRLIQLGHFWLTFRIAEEVALHASAQEKTRFITIICTCLRKLGLWTVASGYCTPTEQQQLCEFLPDDLLDRFSTLANSLMLTRIDRALLPSNIDHVLSRFDTPEPSVSGALKALQSWSVFNDAYSFSGFEIKDATENIAATQSDLFIASINDSSRMPKPDRSMRDCIALFNRVASGAGKLSSLSQLSSTLSIQALQLMLYSSGAAKRALGDDTGINRCMSLLSVNKLRKIGRNALAMEVLSTISNVDDWETKYYAAKIISSEGRPDAAVQLFEASLESCPGDHEPKILNAMATVMSRSKSYSEPRVRAAFEQCILVDKNNLKAHFQLAAFLDDMAPADSIVKLFEVMHAYAKTIMIGDKYDRIACCRFLSSWFAITDNKAFNPKHDDLSEKVQILAGKVARKLPVFKFLPNLSQVASKLCQCDSTTVPILQIILARLLEEYPHTAIWKLANFCISVVASRRDKFQFLFKAAQSFTGVQHVWQEYNKLFPLLIDLCSLQKSREHHLSLSHVLPRLKSVAFSSIAAPTSWTIYRSSKIHKEPVFFSEFEDRVDVLPSLQKPKRIAVRCSDGIRRMFLFKPKDDLRKDMRFLELAMFMNSVLSQFGQMQIYAALPLHEDAGVIEWIDKTCSLRSVLMKLYRERGVSISVPEFAEMQKSANLSNLFVNSVLPRFKPVLPLWFMRTYPEIKHWYTARTAFVKSTAVYSMFGHIMGLGDRHCENLMLCEETGNAMHVDFNCLFEKGKLLTVPERVPFRLTQNIAASFGACGYQGEFHAECAAVMKCLRTHQHTIMANLEPMVNDPTADLQRESHDVFTVMKRVKHKLEGLEDGSVFYSESGHVSYLIEQATSPENLSRMYFGWAPFL